MSALPPSLAGLADFRQFLLYKLVQKPPKVPGGPLPKRTKIPVHPYSLNAVDHGDPKAWVDATTAFNLAAALGEPYGVAFSIQRDNGLFFVDIDSCLTASGGWSDLALRLCTQFAGAAIEVSQSGKGLHILGRGVAPVHGCRNDDLGLELYTEARFVALTGNSAMGDIRTDHTSALTAVAAEFFPPEDTTDGDGNDLWSDTPHPEWRGPTDDNDLLRRAMQSQGNASAFLGKAAFADLWNCNVERLAVSYPDKEKPYNESGADAALAQHLAFWTGNNHARIERIMRTCTAMWRDKWERPDYLPRTIRQAVAKQTDVLRDKPTAAEVLNPATPVLSKEAVRVTGDTFLGPDAQIEFFKGCVYVFEVHRALVPGGHLINPDRFRVKYGGFTFTMDDLNQRTTRDAWEAFTQSQSYRAPRVDRTCFRPDREPGDIILDGSRTLVNQWWPAGVHRVQGDASPFLDHLKKLLPDERDRRILLSYLAACVQHVGVKFQWCPLLQGVEGNGKSLFSRCTAEAVGQRYTHWVRADRIGGQFNSWMLNKVLACVEDIYVPDSKKYLWETLKPMITGDMQEVEPKGVDQDTRNVVINFLLNSNHKDAVRKTRNDRRLAIFYTAQQSAEDVLRDGMGGTYMPDLYAWLKGTGKWAAHGAMHGYAIVADFLYSYPIDPEFNPAGNCQRAPKTSTTDEALDASMGSVELEVLEAIAQNTPGFRGGWISSMALDQVLVRTRNDGRIPRNARKALLEGMGYEWHPGLDHGRVNNDVLPDGGKPRLFLKRSHLAWDMTGAAEIARAYVQAQLAT